MANQKKILPMGRLQGITIDIEGTSTQTYFEVIEIVDESSPYPVLLRIDWATDMNGVINLKNRKMIFEKKSLHLVIPLDSAEGPHYTEPVHDEGSDDALDCIYNITARNQDWINPTVEGRISWEHVETCTTDSDEEDE